VYTAGNSMCEPLLRTLPQNHSTAVTTSNNGRIIFSAMGTLFMLALLLISPAKAGFGAKCIQTWTKSEKKIDGTYSDLSKCQQSTLGLKSVNDILLGGKGGAEIVGFPSGGGGAGCNGGDSCMEQCQALCCITKGCIYSSVKKDTKTTDYVVYKEEETKFYCRMYSSGVLKNSDSQSSCYHPSSTAQQYTSNCEAIAFRGMGWDVQTYQYFAGLSKDNTEGCVAGDKTLRRRLLSASAGVTIPSPSAVRKSIAKAFKPFKTFKKSLKENTTGTQLCH
jgi:hypothetical protein